MLAFGLTLFGLHLNWWETLIALLVLPSGVIVLGELFSD